MFWKRIFGLKTKPVCDQEGEAKQSHIVEEPHYKNYFFGKKVLLFEDNSMYAHIAQSALKDFLVTHYQNHKVAIKHLAEFDCVITDLFASATENDRKKLIPIITDREVLGFTRFFRSRGIKGDWQESLNGGEMPVGLLVLKEALKKNIPCIVATDSDHHQGKGYLAIAAAKNLVFQCYKDRIGEENARQLAHWHCIKDRGPALREGAKLEEIFWISAIQLMNYQVEFFEN